MALLLDTAKNDGRIRAAVLNGSRTNPDAPRDCFQDYDVVYIVRNLASFTADHSWIDRFGPRIMLQMPETLRNPSGGGHFNYQMLFCDGCRIDLTLFPAEKYAAQDDTDSLSVPLLDKDGILNPYPPADDRDYRVQPPAKLDYDSCCNDFWWCSQNVVKGIRRDELPYAMGMYEQVLRAEFHDMIRWAVGVRTDFRVSAGKMGKYFKRYLSEKEYEAYRSTYACADYERLWDAMNAMGGLFRELAAEVAARFGFVYPQADDEQMSAYLRRVRALPPDAKEIY